MKGLTYVTDATPGYSRRKRGSGFIYLNSLGKPVTGAKTLARIESLSIPPAWRDVWICASPRGHLQATGRDQRGRKQHRYHPRFREVQERNKFAHMAEFGAALPALRMRVAADMRKAGLPREKVLAAVVRLLDTTLIRIGNDNYARQNKSYGLTTLKDRHARVRGETLRFVFTGKSGKSWRLTMRDRRVTKIVKAAQDLPGQRLFQYKDDDGVVRRITSGDVNAYLRDAGGRDITAKDFRTWGASVLAAAQLDALGAAKTAALAKANIKDAIQIVADTLGNTPTICRKCYVHPDLLTAYEAGKFKLARARRKGLSSPEAALLAFLRRAPTR